MKTPSRHELGQWFTPPAVADLALSLATEGRPDVSVVDPTCGDGVFLERASARGIGRIRGLDIDESAVLAARARVEAATVEQGSLFAIDPELWLSDAVVGNPPYVRQERMAGESKDRALGCLAGDWEGESDALVSLGRRADLAALCLCRMLRMTRPGGRVSVVVSSALFDAGYARALWAGVQEVAAIRAIVESPEERWFAEAAVNAVIVVLERGAAPARFPIARLELPVHAAEKRVRTIDDLGAVAELRWAEPEAPERWARLMRAPSAWFELEERAGNALVPLGEVAEVRRGITSGANDVFYLSRERARELGIEAEVLSPLVRSPREEGAGTIAVDPASTPMVALTAPADCVPESDFPNAWRYLRGHEAISTRPTLRNRKPWWSLPKPSARLLLTKAYGERFVQRLSPVPVIADQRLYTVSPRGGVSTDVLAAVLNSTFTALALESLGRASLGQGALEWTVDDAKGLPVIDPRRFEGDRSTLLSAALEKLASRVIGSVHTEAQQPDRLQLDNIVTSAFGEASDLARAHEALCAAVARRHRRAESG